MKNNKYMNQSIETLENELDYYKAKNEDWERQIFIFISSLIGIIPNVLIQLTIIVFSLILHIGIITFPIYLIVQCILAEKVINGYYGETTEDVMDYYCNHMSGGCFFIPVLVIFPLIALISLYKTIIKTPNGIYNLIQMFEIKKTIELKENVPDEEEMEYVEDMEETEDLEENNEIKQEEQEDKKDKIVQDIKDLGKKCNLIIEDNRGYYLQRLNKISLDYKDRYIKICRNNNSKVIDLESDNLEKLKSETCKELSVLRLDIIQELEIQKEVLAFSNEINNVIDSIDLSSKQLNESLALRK